MDIVKIAGMGLIAAILAKTIKDSQMNYGFQVSIAASVIILALICSGIPQVVRVFQSFTDVAGMDKLFINILLKIIGITYIADLIAELCRDSGETAIANKVELAGKVAILLVATPIFESVLKLFKNLIGV